MSLEVWGDCDIDSDYDEDPNYCGYCGEPIPPGVDSFDCCGSVRCATEKLLLEAEHGQSHIIVGLDDDGQLFEMHVRAHGELTPERRAAFAELAKAALRNFDKGKEPTT